jgi:hypothetical protein
MFFLSSFQSSVPRKTCIIPLSDAYPLRYTYHTPFVCNRFDSERQWLWKAHFTIRGQELRDENTLANFFFENPLVAKNTGEKGYYNAGILGAGYAFKDTASLRLVPHRSSLFINCTVELSRRDLPYYIHIGFPLQGTSQRITFEKEGKSSKKVLKGGFAKEYESFRPVSSLDAWKTTPSSYISSFSGGLLDYFAGDSLGNLAAAKYGKMTCSPMSLWAIADLYFQIGNDGYCIKNTQLGYYIKGVFPTTPTLRSSWNQYFFYPTIGNVARAEGGAGINGHSILRATSRDQMTLHFDGYLGFMGRSEQMRPYDLRNGFLSRYGQVKLFSQEALTYQNKMIRAIDLLTEVHSIGNCFKTELVLDFVYQRWQHFFSCGYSMKAQGKETISCEAPGCINQRYSQRPFAFGYSPQQYLQTPNPLAVEGKEWTTALITPHSAMKHKAKRDFSQYRDTDEFICGVPITHENQLTRESIDLDSGLMDAQVLNILFVGYRYEVVGRLYNKMYEVNVAVSQSPRRFYTMPFIEAMLSLHLDY